MRALRDPAAGPSQIAQVRGWLRPENFARPGDGELYSLMCDMDAAGMAVDPVTISWQAARRGLRADPVSLTGGAGWFAVPSAREVQRHGLLAEARLVGTSRSAPLARDTRCIGCFSPPLTGCPRWRRRSDRGRRSGKQRYQHWRTHQWCGRSPENRAEGRRHDRGGPSCQYGCGYPGRRPELVHSASSSGVRQPGQLPSSR